MDTLTIPVDDTSLDLIEHALNATLHDPHGTGQPVIIGAEYTINRLLEFWSGNETHDGLPVRLTRDDIIRALIAEIHRLR